MVEKQILKGIVNGEPLFSIGSRYFFAIFTMELTSNINHHIQPMHGNTIVVYYRSTKPCYVRKGDQIEIIGKIMRKSLKQKTESIYVEASKLFNEDLQFSFDY